jgi:hypothetical protein
MALVDGESYDEANPWSWRIAGWPLVGPGGRLPGRVLGGSAATEGDAIRAAEAAYPPPEEVRQAAAAAHQLWQANRAKELRGRLAQIDEELSDLPRQRARIDEELSLILPRWRAQVVRELERVEATLAAGPEESATN